MNLTSDVYCAYGATWRAPNVGNIWPFVPCALTCTHLIPCKSESLKPAKSVSNDGPAVCVCQKGGSVKSISYH